MLGGMILEKMEEVGEGVAWFIGLDESKFQHYISKSFQQSQICYLLYIPIRLNLHLQSVFWIIILWTLDEMTEEEKAVAKAIDNTRRRERGEPIVENDHRLDRWAPVLDSFMQPCWCWDLTFWCIRLCSCTIYISLCIDLIFQSFHCFFIKIFWSTSNSTVPGLADIVNRYGGRDPSTSGTTMLEHDGHAELGQEEATASTSPNVPSAGDGEVIVMENQI